VEISKILCGTRSVKNNKVQGQFSYAMQIIQISATQSSPLIEIKIVATLL